MIAAEDNETSTLGENWHSRLSAIRLADWVLVSLTAIYIIFTILLVFRPGWINSAGSLGFAYDMIMTFSPLALMVLPSRDGKTISLALLTMAVTLAFQWRLGFGFYPLSEQYFVEGAVGLVLALAIRGSEINIRTAGVAIPVIMLITGVMGPNLHSKYLSAPHQALSAPHQALATHQGEKPTTYYTSLTYTDTTFRTLDLRGSDLRGAKFVRSDLSESGVDLQGANLAGASFIDSPINTFALKNADLTGATFEGLSCESVNLGFILPGSAKLTKMNFKCTVPPKLYTSGGEGDLDDLAIKLTFPVHELSVRAKSARRMVFDYNASRHFSLNVEDAEGASFLQSNLPNASFSRFESVPEYRALPMNLRHANFTSAVLTDADFRNVDLRNSSFSGADLRGVTFRECDLTGAELTGAKIGWGTFEETKFLKSATPPIAYLRQWTK